MMSRTQTNTKMTYPEGEVLDTLVEWQDNQEVLREAICDTLLALGWPITKTILWHLHKTGFFLISKEELDVQLFYKHLGQIVGQGAEMIMNQIYENLRRRGEQNA